MTTRTWLFFFSFLRSIVYLEQSGRNKKELEDDQFSAQIRFCPLSRDLWSISQRGKGRAVFVSPFTTFQAKLYPLIGWHHKQKCRRRILTVLPGSNLCLPSVVELTVRLKQRPTPYPSLCSSHVIDHRCRILSVLRGGLHGVQGAKRVNVGAFVYTVWIEVPTVHMDRVHEAVRCGYASQDRSSGAVKTLGYRRVREA